MKLIQIFKLPTSWIRNSVPVPYKDMQVNTLWGNQRVLIWNHVDHMLNTVCGENFENLDVDAVTACTTVLQMLLLWCSNWRVETTSIRWRLQMKSNVTAKTSSSSVPVIPRKFTRAFSIVTNTRNERYVWKPRASVRRWNHQSLDTVDQNMTHLNHIC